LGRGLPHCGRGRLHGIVTAGQSETGANPTARRWARLTGRLGLPSGVLPISLGSIVSAGTAYVFLVVAARVLGPVRYGSLASFWALVFLLGPGAFGPLEQEVCRAMSARRSAGLGDRPVVVRCAQVGGALLVVLLIAVVATSGILTHRFFAGHWLLVVGLAFALAGYCVMQLTWGILAASRHFGSYGLVVGGEGVARLILCVGLLIAGTRSPGLFALTVGLAPFAAVAVGWRSTRVELAPGPPQPWGPTATAITYLLGGSACRQFLITIGPLVVQVLSTSGDAGATGRFLAAVTLTRVPLFLFSAALAALLPRLAAQASSGERRQFAATIRKLSYGVIALALVAGLLSATIGPALVRLFFGADYRVSPGELLLLSLACTGYLLAAVLSYGLIAVGGQLWTTIGWAIGCVMFIAFVAVAAPLELVSRVAWGFLVGTGSSVLAMAAFLVWRHARHPWTLTTNLDSGVADTVV
jgi:O-antigen/teichoic acid export membrane protein